MTKIIAVANRKGGVAKTTTTANLAACFAEAGRRTLLVDLDPQGHSTRYLGLERPGPDGSGAYHVLRNAQPIASYAKASAFGVDVLSSGEDLIHAEEWMRSEPGGEFSLRDALADISERYDLVLLDCPPNLGRLTLAALCAAHSVLTPCMLDALSLDGLAKVNETVAKAASRGLNPGLRLAAIIETRVDREWPKHARLVHEELQAKAGPLLLSSYVRDSNFFGASWDANTPITHFAPKSIGAADYRAAARELQERGIA